MKMRILMFGWEFPPYNSGGLGVACLGLTRALAARGADITFVMPRKLDVSSPWARIIFADGKNILTRSVNSLLSPYLTTRSYAYKRSRLDGPNMDGIYGHDLMAEVLRYAAMGGEIAKEEQFDIIYAHDWLAFGAGMEAKRVSGKPLVVHVHATEFDRCGGPLGINKDVYDIERAGMEAADVVIAVSQLTKNIIVNNYGIPSEKVRVVYNGIDETTAPSGGGGLPRLRALKASGYSLVLFLGRITLQKGPDYFIRAAKRVLERNPKVMFILSGSGDMDKRVMELAASLGIADHVIFTGFLQGAERHEVYAAADLFVMPSVSEPFGITPLEAMRLGTPVLISKQSGVSEIVRHALKTDFWDVDEMANQILALIKFPGLRQTLSNNGSAEAETITWAEAAQKLDGIVHEFASPV
ncbi:MAG TPA: glycosyltransferase family 4 protein [Candidatus Paceibacterota bacterium]|nr:glycosyltransferase family 4 protein [Candidatus Paceibacterota bacterium]